LRPEAIRLYAAAPVTTFVTPCSVPSVSPDSRPAVAIPTNSSVAANDAATAACPCPDMFALPIQ
jgi:hypothetical protein